MPETAPTVCSCDLLWVGFQEHNLLLLNLSFGNCWRAISLHQIIRLHHSQWVGYHLHKEPRRPPSYLWCTCKHKVHQYFDRNHKIWSLHQISSSKILKLAWVHRWTSATCKLFALDLWLQTLLVAPYRCFPQDSHSKRQSWHPFAISHNQDKQQWIKESEWI